MPGLSYPARPAINILKETVGDVMIEINDVSYTYANNASSDGLHHLNLKVNKGEVVILCGPSGCGKTTITRLVNGLIPHFFEGDCRGSIRVCGHDTMQEPIYALSHFVGSVFQDPRSQFFTTDSTSELAFGGENMGLPEDEIRQRVWSISSSLGIERLMGRSMFALSGGEKQQIACAAVSVVDPEVLVLDEPSSNLDSRAIGRLHEQIALWKEQGKTILIAEHRLHYLRALADRIIYMRQGGIVREFTPRELARLSDSKMSDLGLRALSFSQIAGKKTRGPENLSKPNRKFLHIQDLRFAYKRQPECLHITEASIPVGSLVALIGENGAGKSTLARCLSGLERRSRGTICLADQQYRRRKRLQIVYMVMQDVNHQLFTESVLDEVLLSMHEPQKEEAERILDQLGLAQVSDNHPMALSGGQKQRVAMASAIASGREILLLDEPTSGLDLLHMQKMATLLSHFQVEGRTVITITHDPEFIIECCDYVLELEKGGVKASYWLDEEGKEHMLSFPNPW